MLKWFRRKKDDKALANHAEQEIATMQKMDMLEIAKKKLEVLFAERRYHTIPVDPDRRRA